MKIRRTAAVAAAAALAAGSLLVSAVPASAAPVPTPQIPSCSSMLVDPGSDFFADFIIENGNRAVPYNLLPPLYGSENSALQSKIIAGHGTNCTWGVNGSPNTRNFTMSETAMTPTSVASLRSWYATEGIVGQDDTATLGGVLYHVSKHETDVLVHGRVWIAVTERNALAWGIAIPAAVQTLYDNQPWIFTGGY